MLPNTSLDRIKIIPQFKQVVLGLWISTENKFVYLWNVFLHNLFKNLTQPPQPNKINLLGVAVVTTNHELTPPLQYVI